MSSLSTSEHTSIREQQLEEWRAVAKGLEEALALAEADPSDEDNLVLCGDFEVQLADCVAKLNKSERSLVGIEPTPNAKFIQLDTTGSTVSAPNTPSMVCIFNEPAPYQVHFDGKKWYSCVVMAVEDPTVMGGGGGNNVSNLDRIKYKVWVLGYNVMEVVHAEDLRKFKLDLHEAIANGQEVFAVHPTLGRFVTATVDKVTPKNTVVVRYSPPAPASGVDAPAVPEELEVPLSHILNGKWYPQLKKIEKLSAEEKKAKAKEKKAKKREREIDNKRSATEEAFRTMQESRDFLDL